MYGKVFEQMFTGSMVGAGPDVFAVWTYAIVHARPPGEVELNPRLLSVMLGMTIEDVEKVIAKLCSPDPYSRTPDHDGTRMVRRGQFLYFLPNWKKYRDIRNDEERREKEREYRRRYRSMGKEGCPDLSGTCPDLSEHDSDNSGLSGNVRNGHASESASEGASVVEEREHEREEAPKKPRKPKADPALFDRFWAAYPRKVAKGAAVKMWASKVGTDAELAEQVIAAAQAYAESPDVRAKLAKNEPQYIAHASTWLNAERWLDEIPGVKPVRTGPPKMTDDEYADSVQDYRESDAATRAQIRQQHVDNLEHAKMDDYNRKWTHTFFGFIDQIDREDPR